MKEHLEKLFTFDRQLLGKGYDEALSYIDSVIPLEILEFSSGTKLETWTVPDEWIVKEAWVKFKGRKIIDYAKSPLSLLVYSEPFSGTISLEELKKHLYTDTENPSATPYAFRFYDRDWGVTMPHERFEKLKEGEYEVHIDTEFRPGVMKVGVHTIPGVVDVSTSGDREILLFAHLDHAYQANDNLSAVVCLMDLAEKIKKEINFLHTIKVIFCPETIGSIAYAVTQDLSKVDFMIAVDICGNDNTLLVQQTFNHNDYLNKVAHCALHTLAKPYRRGRFRTSIGSDEYAFNDPLIDVPGILVTTWPYKEYHTSDDTPEKINYDKIVETGELIQKVISIYERNYTPVRTKKGPLMRSAFGIQSSLKEVNLNYDYLWYDIDGKKTVCELASSFEISFDVVHDLFEKLIEKDALSRTYPSQE